MKKNIYTICVIKGDGIGPEVIDQSLQLLEQLPIPFRFIEARAGYDCYKDIGTPLPSDTIKKCESADSVLFGAVTSPPNIKNYFSPIVRLRKVLDLFANVRPFISLPISNTRQDINFIIVRENTEDLYLGKERKTKEGAIAERIITIRGSKRIIEFAFHLATRKKRKKVTVVHKANVLRLTDGLFLGTAQRIAPKYPSIYFDDMLVDAVAMNLIKKPETFDVIVTTNMFGDILSDEAAALIGGLGVAASANIGKSHALFEPVHGSAPKYKGKNRINPLATFFAVCMMLEYLKMEKHSQMIKKAIMKTMKKRCITPDIGGSATTTEVTQEVIKNLRVNYDHY